MALASISGALLMRAGTPPFAAIIAMVGIGVAVGFFNGCAVRLLACRPFMVTLTTMMFFGGFAIWLTKSANVAGLPVSFLQIEKGTVWVFPVSLLLAGILALATHVLLSRTLYGQWLDATGMNPNTAAASGLPVHRVVIATYVLCGVCAAIAGVLLTARLETGSPVLGQHILLDVIGAAVIGGTSLSGGRGSIRGTLFGVLFIALLYNSLNLIGFSYFLVLIVKGAVILAAALLDALRTRTLAGA
jgi:ribose transport system permease protein